MFLQIINFHSKKNYINKILELKNVQIIFTFKHKKSCINKLTTGKENSVTNFMLLIYWKNPYKINKYCKIQFRSKLSLSVLIQLYIKIT